ncbi:response regulator [Caldibacillus debilis]|uniref:response regulator n=1 Tax=Caldibacillus debilis TaxID=301148 RepID=UPI00035CECC7|nr:response regulator [Caldibacillus debilis]
MDIKIVLADDEMIERKAMKKIIDEHFGKSVVIGEAANGRQAIQLAKEKKPDLMLMDVKMPGIDGLEAIETIRKDHPNMKFIMVSAYDSFEYAKRAMKEGVKEYILKPATIKETVEAIIRVYKEIAEERERAEKEQKSREFTKRLFMQKLAEYDVNDETVELQKEIFPSFRSGLFLIGEFSHEADVDGFIHACNNWREGSAIADKKRNQASVLILSGKKLAKADVLSFVRECFLSTPNKKWIGIGDIYERLKDLPKSYQEALLTLQHLKKADHAGYGFPHVRKAGGTNWPEEICDCLFADDLTGALNRLQAFFSASGQRDAVQELYFKIKQRLGEKGIGTDEYGFKDILSLQEWRDFLHFCCLQVSSYHQSQGYIERAKAYIQEHYQEPVALEDVANVVGLSPPYFTKLFKEKTGQTFIDYLTEIRLKKAKELLLENRLSLKEISYQVGYKDPNYFSRVFKKYFHQSPRKFQNRILKK